MNEQDRMDFVKIKAGTGATGEVTAYISKEEFLETPESVDKLLQRVAQTQVKLRGMFGK